MQVLNTELLFEGKEISCINLGHGVFPFVVFFLFSFDFRLPWRDSSQITKKKHGLSLNMLGDPIHCLETS